jgi:2-haloacid dehalogenase
MALADVRALTFDVFGTVVNWRDSIAREAQALFAPKGFARDWHAFADRWRARYRPAMDRIRSGEREWVKLDVLHRENLIEVLEEFKIAGLSAAEVDHLTRGWWRLDPWPDTVEGLNRLKRKFILATLSNGNIALMVNMAKYAHLPWDVILGSEIARAYKPSPEAYDRSAAALDLAPGQCMMVAAHPGDLQAAAGRGFRTAYVDRPFEGGPPRPNAVNGTHGVDFVANSFTDLADKLGC